MSATTSQEASHLLGRLSESATLAMARKSRELAEQGIAVVNLSLGEPDFETPDFIKDAAAQAIAQNYSHYMPVNGYLDFRKAICRKFARDNGIAYSPEQIVVSTGAKQSIANVVLSLLNPGDEVLLPAPYWVSYVEMVKMAGATPVIVESTLENEYKVSAEELERHLSPATRLIIFSSPCNPSGSMFTEEEIRSVAAVVKRYARVIVISDEIYEHIQYGTPHFSMASIPGMESQVVTVNGVSKAFAMTGWRIGYMGAPLWLAQACTKLQGQFTSGASSIAQRAAMAAVEASPDVTRHMVAEFEARKKLFADLLSAIPGMEINDPQGAFYLFPRVTHFFGKSDGEYRIANSDDLAEYLLARGHVATVSGDAFGISGCLRLSYAASQQELKEAAQRITAALNKLN